MAGADIALRVSTTGADEARAKLALVGETGTQALTRINAASSEASGGMEAFSTARPAAHCVLLACSMRSTLGSLPRTTTRRRPGNIALKFSVMMR
jgi:hypothetical protein